MADRFWVGGSGNWDASSTANWAASSGGSAGASAPTSADDVYFDAASNVGTGAFTVTVTGTSASPAVCKSFATGGTGGALDGAMTLTMGATARLNCNGSMTLPASSLSVSGTSGAVITFVSTTSQTLTTNGVSLGNVSVTVDGVAGTLTLGSALTCSTLTVTNGTFDTSASNYNVTAGNLSSSNSNIRTITLNGSTVSISNDLTFTTATNLTFNAGTSTISCGGTNPSFNGGGQTFYNVTFASSNSGTSSIVGANTYNNLTQTSVAATGIRFVNVGANQTVNGSLTLGAANTAIRRIFVYTSATGTQRTITLNGSLAALADVDFSDIVAAGTVARPWTGTRIGDAKNNSGITFDTPKTVYWNLAGSQNWSATGWALTNNGTPAVNNFPLVQDTATFTEAGAAGTVTLDTSWQIGSIQMADGVSNRTTAFTLATATRTPNIYGNVTLFSSLTFTGTGTLTFAGQGVTQTLTSAGLTLTQPITINNVNGTVQLQDNLTIGSTLTTTLTSGTLDLNGKTLSTGFFSSSNSNSRTIVFGTGNITLTGNSGTIWNCGTLSGFAYTGTPTVNSTYSGSTGTRTINHGVSNGPATETNSVSFYFNAGTDTVTLSSSSFNGFKNLVFTGFSGTLSNSARTIYGNLTISSGMTLTAGTAVTTFAGTSGPYTITTNGKTIDFPVTFNGINGTWTMDDALTLGSTRALTMINGTLQLKAGTTSTIGSIVTSDNTPKSLTSSVAGSQATLSDVSGTNEVYNLKIQDIAATGGATWRAYTQYGNVNAGNNSGWVFSTQGVKTIFNNVLASQIIKPIFEGIL